MHSIPTIFAALLAGQFAAAIPLLPRHGGEDDTAPDVVTVTHIVSLTTYVKPTSSSTRPTMTLTQTLYTTVQSKSASRSPSATPDVNPINGLPVPPPRSSTSTVSFDPPQSITWFGPGPAPPNPTAKPSMFQTKPFTTRSSTSSSEAVNPSPEKSRTTPFVMVSSESPKPSSSTSTSTAFESPRPSKESKTSSASETISSSASDTWEYPYPTKESKTSSASDAKETHCAYPYPGCDE